MLVLPRKLLLALSLTLISLISLSFPKEIQAASDYYAATNGSDSNPGTLSKPWRTIGKATQTLQAGDTVYIRGGTYNERIVPIRSGSSGKKITYTSYQNEAVVVRGESNVQTIVNISGKNHIVIDGLKMQHQNTNGWNAVYFLVMIGGSSKYNEIKNSELIRQGDPIQLFQRGIRERGIQIGSGAEHTLIEDNYIRGFNIGIIVGRGSNYTTIRENTITETQQSSVDFSGGGLGHNLVENNVLELSAIEDGIQFEWDYDIDNTHITDHSTVIRNNIIRNNAENAIDLKGAGNIVIEGNIIYGTIGASDGPLHATGWNRESLFTIMKGANAQTNDVIIRNNVLYDNAAGMMLYDGYRAYNNTVVGNNHDYTGPNSTYKWNRKPAFWGIQHGDGKVAVQNNIVVGHSIVEVAMRPGSGREYINHNLYYNSQGVYFTDFRANYDWERMTFDQWKTYLQGKSTVTGKDGASIVTNPKFVNAPEKPVGTHNQFDFRLQSSSPAIDKGGPLTYANGSGSGINLKVDDARYFSDGYGIASGDLIKIGSNSIVRVNDVNFSTNTLVLASSKSWKDNDWVTLAYQGAAPDIGAYEYGGSALPTTPTPTSPSSATNTPTLKPPTSTPTQVVVPGDIDGDGDVDIFDYNLLVENFGKATCGNVADINSDCKVDIFDYNIVIENFGNIT